MYGIMCWAGEMKINYYFNEHLAFEDKEKRVGEVFERTSQR